MIKWKAKIEKGYQFSGCRGDIKEEKSRKLKLLYKGKTHSERKYKVAQRSPLSISIGNSSLLCARTRLKGRAVEKVERVRDLFILRHPRRLPSRPCEPSCADEGWKQRKSVDRSPLHHRRKLYIKNISIASVLTRFLRTYAFHQCDCTCGSAKMRGGWSACRTPCTCASSECWRAFSNWTGSSWTGVPGERYQSGGSMGEEESATGVRSRRTRKSWSCSRSQKTRRMRLKRCSMGSCPRRRSKNQKSVRKGIHMNLQSPGRCEERKYYGESSPGWVRPFRDWRQGRHRM